MIYGAINQKDEKWYTHLGKVFEAIKQEQLNYNWLITDCVCYPQDKEIEALLDQEYCWLTGEELTAIVEKENFQWIWAVLSGFDKNISLSDVLKHPLPSADGYTGFWKNPISLQHPLATIEIVPWDSSLTLLISKKQDIVENYMKYFPQSQTLEEYNAE